MTKKSLKVFIVSDFHVPFQNKDSVNKLLEDIKTEKPDTLILNGDILDFYQLSRFSKNPTRLLLLQKDLNIAKNILSSLRKVMGKKRILYIEGNHEQRLQRYLEDNPELYSLDSLRMESLLNLKEYNIEYISDESKSSYIKYNNINIGHFDVVRKHAGLSALALAVEKGGSYIQAHSHRLGTVFKRFNDEVIIAGECGCMCDLTPSYCFKPDWCNGYLIMEIDSARNVKIKPVLL